MDRPDVFVAYVAATTVLRAMECPVVGLMLGVDDWEYPVWAFLANETRSGTRIEHVAVDNVSARLARPGARPVCAILRTGSDLPRSFAAGSANYRLAWTSESVSVYRRAE